MTDNPANPVIESRSSTTAFGNIGHPGGMDWETYRELPPEITWAWARAFARDSSSLSEQRSVDDYKRISDRYKAVVRDLGKFPFISSSWTDTDTSGSRWETWREVDGSHVPGPAPEDRRQHVYSEKS